MIKKKNVVCPSLCAMLVVAACFFVQAAQASTVSVGTPNCTTLINFATIQLAVSSVPPGSTIKICPGTYPEQVLITKKLTLEGIPSADGSHDAVVITPPAGGMVVNTTDQQGPVAAQVLVQNASGAVVISNLTVDGKGNQYNTDDLRGICYQDASGTVKNVAVRNEVPNDTPTGIQSGQGILVETTNSSSASLTVTNSSVHNYNKNGIVARYAGATLTATGNYVQGNGPTDIIAQNGIELAHNGATGTIKNNTVIDNFYTPTTDSASDILLFDSRENGSITVSGNILGNSNIAIALFTTTPGTFGDGVTVSTNKIFGTSTFDGIDVCTNSNIIQGNTIFNSAESGIHLDASCTGTGTGNNVAGNTILESACAGVLTDPGTGTVGANTFFTVPFPVTSSTASCAIAGVPTRGKTAHKLQP
jgi:parallel beta-helix repeat protein